LIPANIAAYGEGLEIPEDQIRLYVALREGRSPAALRSRAVAARRTFSIAGRGVRPRIKVDREAVEEAMSRVDPTDPSTMQEIPLEGIFSAEDSPAQKAALSRLETALALVEGWVSHVVQRASADRLPDAERLAETFRRRRAAGGPAEQTFSALVGLELRPRRLREATVLWDALAEHRGIEGRDAVWTTRPASQR
jgi:putative hydrolase